MLKYTLTGLFSLIIGAAIGVVGTIFLYPFLFPPPVLNEQVQNIAAKTVYATGTFIHPNPSDKLHYGKGTVTVYMDNGRYEVFLNKDFQVGPGPAFHVYVTELSDVKTRAAFKSALKQGKATDLGVLKSFKGSQVYSVPNSVDMSNVHSVVVWCKSFNQLITSAALNKNG